jgi:hypothetical protein
MTEASPWDAIAMPGSDYNVRQISSPAPVRCFWGRDTAGCYLFIIELEGEHTAQFRKNVSNVNGIGVDLREGGIQRFVLTLERQVDRDLFEGLCRTLIVALQAATDSTSSLAVALAHIKRWKTFLSGKGGQLSGEEIRGLFAELIFLREMLDHLPSKDAVESWLGPDRSHQDFIFGNTAIEIKSVSGTERSTVRISSEDQLESLNDNLFLRVYRLSSLSDAQHAASLNSLVGQVQSRLTDADAVEDFQRKLVTHRYAPLPEYDEPLLVVSEVRSFKVEDGFPRLVRSGLPEGIIKVAYDIKLEDIESFRCDDGRVLGGG